MRTRYRLMASLMLVIVLVAGCGTAEPTATPVPTAAAVVLPIDTPAFLPTSTPVPPSNTPEPSPTATPTPPRPVPTAATESETAPTTPLSLEEGSQSFGFTETAQASLGDLDGDGDLDAVFANMAGDSKVWLNDGMGLFVDSGQKLTEQGHGLDLGDLDGDGDLDLFITCAHRGGSGAWSMLPSRVYLNDGQGTFEDSGQDVGDKELSGNGVNLVDIDGDGDWDVHVVYYEPDGMPDKVYLNDGSGRFTDSGLAIDEEAVAWGDLDNDGDVDLFGKAIGQGYNVWLNDGSGQLALGWKMVDDLSIWGDVALGDMDGDGDLDALVARGFRDEGSHPTLLLLNDGAGQFSDSGQQLNETSGSHFAVGDLNGDGALDLFVSNMDLPDQAWLNDGSGQLVDSDLRLGSSTSFSLSTIPSLGDLDGDGDLDVIVGSFQGTAKLWFNNTPISGSEENGLYLGQTPPGLEVELFAPGVVSIEDGKEYKITVSPDSQEIFFTRRTPGGRDDRLWYSRLESGKLTLPELAPFACDCFETDPCFSPDGERLYFSSSRPLPGRETLSGRPNMWFVDRTEEGWSEPQFLGPPINDYEPVYFSFADDGTLYFTRSSPREIWYAEPQDGHYSEARSLPDEINYLTDVAHPAVAPDESYIIVDSYSEKGGRLVGSLYISFRRPDGSWTRAVSMQDALQATESDIYATPRVAPNGEYILFEKYEQETDKGDIYWVSAKVIEKLRSRALQEGLIAFVSTRDGNGEIYVMGLDGSNPRRLTNWRGWDGYPTWSPDGKQIAYYSYLNSKEWVIKVMDADGGNQRQLTDNGICDGAPHWSPDGAYIAYSSDADCTAEHREIYVVDAGDAQNSSRQQRNVTNHEADDVGSSWSPDSQQIVFASNRDGDYEIYVIDADGGNPRRLTQDAAQDMMPAWSPDGTQIAFGSDRDGNDEIYVMDTDGGNVRRLTDHPSSDWFPFWSPDGTQILFNSQRDGNLEIYVMDADGGNVRRLTDNRAEDFNAVWQPLPSAAGEVATWIRTYEGEPRWTALDALPTSDGGYLLAGATNYSHSNTRQEDIYVVRTDADGQIIWAKTYGGDGFDRANRVAEASDGGFVVLGETASFGAGAWDVYLLRLDRDGNELWSRTFGGPRQERANAIQRTTDDGYILAGQTASFGERSQLYLIKTDEQGVEIWSRTYGSERDWEGNAIRQTPDGGFLALAQALDGDRLYVDQDPDVVLLRTDGSGNEIWSQVWEKENVEGGHALLPTSDGGYVVAGITSPAGNESAIDYLFVKIDADGNRIWSRTLGDGDAVDYGTDVIELPAGGYLLVGMSNRSGLGAIPLIRTGADGEIVWQRNFIEGRGNKAGMRILPTLDGGYLIVGNTDEFRRGFETILIKTDGEGNVAE